MKILKNNGKKQLVTKKRERERESYDEEKAYRPFYFKHDVWQNLLDISCY